jgi:hypothetical protein
MIASRRTSVQRRLEQARQRQRQQVDADVVVGPADAGRDVVHLIAFAEALRVNRGRLAPQGPLPLARLLQQVLPGDLPRLPALELDKVHGLDHRLLRSQQAAVEGHARHECDETFRRAVGHLRHVGIAQEATSCPRCWTTPLAPEPSSSSPKTSRWLTSSTCSSR